MTIATVLVCTEKPLHKGKWCPTILVTDVTGKEVTDQETGPGAIVEVYFKVSPWTLQDGTMGNSIKMDTVRVLVKSLVPKISPPHAAIRQKPHLLFPTFLNNFDYKFSFC